MTENNNINSIEEKELSDLAFQWRFYHSQIKYAEASAIVDKYHEAMAKFWKTGWRGDYLPLDAELPDELMPKYFLEYWQRN